MVYALKFPPDVTEIIMSMRDWRYEQVRAEGGTPSARCLPELMPIRPISTNMEPGKFYMSRLEYIANDNILLKLHNFVLILIICSIPSIYQ